MGQTSQGQGWEATKVHLPTPLPRSRDDSTVSRHQDNTSVTLGTHVPLFSHRLTGSYLIWGVPLAGITLLWHLVETHMLNSQWHGPHLKHCHSSSPLVDRSVPYQKGSIE